MAEPKTGEILWYQPDPRAVIPLRKFHCPRSLMRKLKRGEFSFSVDVDFPSVIQRCAERREGTWLSDELIQLYRAAFQLGHAHSIEVWHNGELAGGLYGLSIGKVFFAESMFHRVTDASKAALYALVQVLGRGQAHLLEVQFLTEHLAKFGAIEISGEEYQEALREGLAGEPIPFEAGVLQL